MPVVFVVVDEYISPFKEQKSNTYIDGIFTDHTKATDRIKELAKFYKNNNIKTHKIYIEERTLE